MASISPRPATSEPEPSASARQDGAKAGPASTAARQPPHYDGWEIDEQLRHARRVLGSATIPRKPSDQTADEPKFRLDAGHEIPSPHTKRDRRTQKKKRRVAQPQQRAPGDRLLSFLAWMTLSLGTSAFVCGVALMAWSMNTGRQELWTIGTPIVFAGQIGLVMGLVLQLDRVWRDSRWTTTKMKAVDDQLHDLKMATTLLNTSHGPSSTFYAHWAGGAGPEILLGDLKNQLDLLAVKLS